MDNIMKMRGEDFEANYDARTGAIVSISTSCGDTHTIDRGVSAVLDTGAFSTYGTAPDAVEREGDSVCQVYAFGELELRVITSIGHEGSSLRRQVMVKSAQPAQLTRRTFLDIEILGDSVDFVRHRMWKSSLTALFARCDGTSLVAMFDHPFGIVEIEGGRVRLSENTYARLRPDTCFSEGALHISPAAMTGNMQSQAPIDELDYAHANSWQPSVRSRVGKSWWVRGEADLDEGEIRTARVIAQSLLPWEKGRAVSCHVPWCENDFEFDISTDEGERIYTRMLDLLQDIGCGYTLLTPGGGARPSRPDGGWQHVMWLGIGAMVANMEWTPSVLLPPRTQRLLDLAREKGIGVLAYVNPAYRFADKWQRMSQDGSRQDECCYACDEYSDWLIRTLIDFKNAYGLAGYCLDFISEHHPCYDPNHDHVPGPDTHLVGWRAFQSVTRALNEADPDIVIDGRLCTYRFAPFAAAGITYPHPFICDEQPNHMTAWPDLSMNRVFANFQRRVAYWGRNRFFLPNYKIPGFMTHQQIRTFRWKHSWDRLGWKYSVLSSIAVSGINNVVNYLPVREQDEYEAFTTEDRAWFNKWLHWTEDNTDLLLHARDIFGEPAPEKVDGISACANGRGALFLINPNYRPKHVQFTVGEAIGLDSAEAWMMTELHPNAGCELGWITHNEPLKITVPPHQVLVIELTPQPADRLSDDRLFTGREQDWIGADVGDWRDSNGSRISFPYEFRQAPGWQVDEVDTVTKPTHWLRFSSDWTPDLHVRARLDSQRTPIKLEEHESIQPYLDPGRLLMTFAFRFPENVVQATMKVNSRSVPVEICYLGTSPRVVEPEYRERNICALYADLDGRIDWNGPNRLEVEFAHYGPCEWVGAFVENM